MRSAARTFCVICARRGTGRRKSGPPGGLALHGLEFTRAALLAGRRTAVG